jgi:hypothetical protein
MEPVGHREGLWTHDCLPRPHCEPRGWNGHQAAFFRRAPNGHSASPHPPARQQLFRPAGMVGGAGSKASRSMGGFTAIPLTSATERWHYAASKKGIAVEMWLPVPEWEEYYEVSSIGRVRSRERMAKVNARFPNARRRMGGKLLKLTVSRDGYFSVHLSAEDRTKTCRVHLLVLAAFHGSRPNGMIGRHLDGSRQNNERSNLCWGTHTENMLDRTSHGTVARGERHGMAKLTDEQAVAIYRSDEPGEVLAARYGVTKSKVSDIRRGRTWRHATGGDPLPPRNVTGKRKSDKLSYEKAAEIRWKHENGLSYSKLSREYRVSVSAIAATCNQKTWVMSSI